MTQIKLSKDSPLPISATMNEQGAVLTFMDEKGKYSININDLIESPMTFTRANTTRVPTNKQKIEKRYTIPADKFSLVDFTNLGCVDEDKSMMPKFVVGENYALGGEKIEGFVQKHKLYNLVGIVDEFAGTKVDSLVVKQIGGEEGNIYTISRNDCAFLGIEYQNGLQLFSKSLAWKHVRNLPEFDEHNLSTSPTSEIDNSIRYLVFKLNGFTDYSDGYVLSPSGKLIKENQFVQSVQVITKEPVVYGNGHMVQDKVPLRANVTHPRSKLFNHGNFISSDDEVFILVELVDYKSHVNAKTFDGKFGVDPKYFEGLDPNEYFEISWDELGGLTVDEYEENKRKAAEEAERIAKEKEEEQKRLLAEAEKAAVEKARLESLMVERMKMFKIREPEIKDLPTFNNTIDPIVGIDMYLDSLDDYFNDMGKTLNNISDDLYKFDGIGGKKGMFDKLDEWSNAYRSGLIGGNQLLKFLEERF